MRQGTQDWTTPGPRCRWAGLEETGAVAGTPLRLSILNPDWLAPWHTCRLEGGRRALEAPSEQA